MSFFAPNGFLGLSWLGILLMYVVPGLAYSAFHLIKQYRDKPSKSAREFLAAIGHGKKKTISNYIGDAVIYSIAMACIALGWPAFLIWAYFQSKKEAAREIERNKPDFNCAPEYLIAKVNPVDAEIASYVVDPLGCVPPLPFGHLNAGWVKFLSELSDEADEMWSFHVPKDGQHGKYKFPATSDIRGYARVRNGEILGEFITESD